MNKEQLNLLKIGCSGETVVLSLSDGSKYELARESLPLGLPEVGGRIDSPLLAEIEQAAARKQVARAAFRLLDRRLYPLAVLREKLLAADFGSDVIDEVLQQFQEKGVHDDRRFAEAFCRDTLRRQSVGRRYLESKLRQKQVSQQVARTVVAELVPLEREAELALAAATKRWARWSKPVDASALARMVRFLIGRGFPAGLANRLARSTAPDAGGRVKDGEA